MILKPFEPYEFTLGLAALLKRLDPSHEKIPQIIDDLNKQEAGEHGERHVLTILETNQLPDKTVILHNVSFVSNVQVQIDVLIISPSWCLILEVKNMTGDLYFSSNPPQLICIKGEKENIYDSPEAQVQQYSYGLSSFLGRHQIKIPIYGAIIYPFNNANIKKPPEKILLFMGRQFIKYIWSLPKGNQLVDPKKVGKLLIKQKEQWDRFPLNNYYGINLIDFLSGVECPNCGTIPMQRTSKTWKCTNKDCGMTDHKAHFKALADYYMLMNKNISNKECVRFLNLKNHQQAFRILRDSSLKRTGHSRNSIYELKPANALIDLGKSVPSGRNEI